MIRHALYALTVSKRLSRSLLFAALGLGIPACGPIYVPSPASQTTVVQTSNVSKPKVLRIHLSTYPDSLDPQKASSPSEIAILQLAYEGLTRWDENGRVVPGAARAWEFGDGGKTLTFHLHRDLIRTDGTRLTARDFEYALKRTLDPRAVAPMQSLLDDVKGAAAAYSLDPRSKSEEIQKAMEQVGIVAPDDFTLVFTFNQPTGFFPTIAAMSIAYPAERSKVESDLDAWWAKPENHNGNGPFRIAQIEESVIRLTRNPYYWSGGARIERIELRWNNDPATLLRNYRDGELEIARLSTESLELAMNDRALSKELVRSPAARATYLGFNVKKAPFTDKAVRIAFSQAIDREGFVNEVLKGFGKPALTWIPSGVPGHDETASNAPYDPRAAVQTLASSAFGTADKRRVDCSKLGTVKLSYGNTPRNQVIFQFIVGSLARTFGCPILLDPIEPKDYPFVIRDPRTAPQVFLITWEQEYPHPQNWLFLQTCNGVFALRLGYCSREFDAALALANQETDYDRALEKYRAAQRIFVNDAVALFLWSNENAFLVKPYVIGPRDKSSSADYAWLGQFGPLISYDIDLARTGVNYPSQ